MITSRNGLVMRFKRLYSLQNLAKEENNKMNSEKEKEKETKNSQINQISQINRIKSSKMFQLLQSKSNESFYKFGNILRGPVRSNILISYELLKLISNEQKLIPDFSTWNQAKKTYVTTFNRLRSGDIGGGGGEVTWGQVGRFLRIGGEMMAFYYIGEMVGMVLSIPFK